jgi:hypothetical protein
MTTPPQDILDLDDLIDNTVIPQGIAAEQAFFDANGYYAGVYDLSTNPAFDYLPANSYFVSSYVEGDGTHGFTLWSRITSATPTVVSEPYIPNYDDDLPPEEQIVEYRDVTYYDWERVDDIHGNNQYWQHGDFEGEPL